MVLRTLTTGWRRSESSSCVVWGGWDSWGGTSMEWWGGVPRCHLLCWFMKTQACKVLPLRKLPSRPQTAHLPPPMSCSLKSAEGKRKTQVPAQSVSAGTSHPPLEPQFPYLQESHEKGFEDLELGIGTLHRPGSRHCHNSDTLHYHRLSVRHTGAWSRPRLSPGGTVMGQTPGAVTGLGFGNRCTIPEGYLATASHHNPGRSWPRPHCLLSFLILPHFLLYKQTMSSRILTQWRCPAP